MHVEGDGDGVAGAHGEQLLSGHYGSGGDGVVWRGAVVGHKQSVVATNGASGPVVGAASVVQHPFVGGIGEVSRVRQAGGVHGRGTGRRVAPVADVVAAAERANVELVSGGGRQVLYRKRICGDGSVGGLRGVIGIESRITVGDLPAGGGTDFRPSQFETVDGSVHNVYVLWFRTSRDDTDFQIVDVGIGGSGSVLTFESDVLTRAGVLAEDDLFRYPSGSCTARSNRVNAHKGAGIARVSHHTHDQTVGGVGGSEHEVGLQGVDGNRRIKLRDDSNVVGAAGACIEVEGAHTFIVSGIHVRSVGGVGVDLAPAERICGFASAVSVEVFRVRQLRDGIALGGCGECRSVVA